PAVQLREKDLPPEELLPLARLLRPVTRHQAAFILNGPLEVALAAEADGVHLPENAVMVERPQRPFLIGRSVHSLEAAERARAEGSDYLIAGSIFQTASHPNAKPAGLELIESIVGVVTAPVLAVGGITDRRVRDVVRAGASGVAVISYILSARSPRSEEHTSELQSRGHLVCRLLLEKKKKPISMMTNGATLQSGNWCPSCRAAAACRTRIRST